MLMGDLGRKLSLLDTQLVVDVANSPHRRRRILCASLLITCANDALERHLTTGDAHVNVRCVNEWVGCQAVAHVFKNARVRTNVALRAVTGEAARSRLRKRTREATLGRRQRPTCWTIFGIARHSGPLTARDRISSF
jgi:hypothetical protein